MRTTLLGVNNKIISKAGLEQIRSGDIIFVKILDNKKGLIKASIKGKILSLNGDLSLKTGDRIRVRAEWSGKTLYLNKLADKTTIKNMIIESGVKYDSNSAVLFEAARSSGLSLTENNLKILKRLLRNKSGLKTEEARIAVEAIKKGLNPEEIICLIESENKFDRKKQKKNILFNQLKDGNELWFIVPYSFDIEARLLEGSIRIKKNTDTSKIQTVVIESSYGKGRLFFLIDNYSSTRRTVKILYDENLPEKVKAEIKSTLPEILGNLSMKIDDNIIENCFTEAEKEPVFDGFSLSVGNAVGIEALV